MGLPTATALVVANMIGAGVFTTSGYSIGALGSRGAVLWAWVCGGLLAGIGALCYSALARRFPQSGGEYEYLRRTVSPFAGFMAGWVSLLAGFTAPIAAAAEASGLYLGVDADAGFDPRWVGTLVIVAAGLLHGVRVDPGLRLQNLLVAVKLLWIVGLIGVGGWVILGREAPPADGSFEGDGVEWIGAFSVSLIWIYFAYSGWNAAVYVGGEVRDPKRTLPRALLGGTALVCMLYLGLNAVFLYSAPAVELAGQAEIGAVAAAALGGGVLRTAVGLLVALALFTSVTSMVMVGPRVYARMAEDGLFPRLFRAGREAPRAAIALQCGLALLILWSSDLLEKLTYIGWMLGVSTAVAVFGLILQRRREGAGVVPVIGWPVLPWVYVLVVLGTAGFGLWHAMRSDSTATLYAAITLGLGAVAYPLFRRSRSTNPG